jgi:hypothetical protein
VKRREICLRKLKRRHESHFTVKLCRLLCVTLRPNTSACLGVIAVTFGTLGKPFDRRGLWNIKIRSLSLHYCRRFIYEDRAE